MELAIGSAGSSACARRRASARVLLLAFFAAAAALVPGRAGAFPSVFTLQTGSSLTTGSGATLGGNFGVYGAGTVFPAELTPIPGTNEFTVEVGSFSIPDVEFAFGGDVFSFELLDLGVPTDAFALTLELPGGHLNPGLADPPLEVRMTRTFDGTPAGTGTFSLPLTTGELEIPACGPAAARTISGVPLDVGSGAVELVGGTCITEFDGAPSAAVFQIRLVGTLPLGSPVPALSAWGLLALAGATAGIGISRLRAAPARGERVRTR